MPEKPLAQKSFRYQTIIVAHIVVYLRGGYGSSSQNGLPNAAQNEHDRSICGPLNFDQDQPNTYISSYFCIYVMDTQLYAVPILLLKHVKTMLNHNFIGSIPAFVGWIHFSCWSNPDFREPPHYFCYFKSRCLLLK